MMRPSVRRSLSITLLSLLILAQLWVHGSFVDLYTYYPFVSGWWLFGLSALAYLYTVRKRLVFIPLGRVSFWMQLHLYGGVLTAFALISHTDFKLPEGLLEIALVTSFCLLLLTGVVSIVLARVVPVLLTSRSGEYLFETILSEIAQLQREVEDKVLESVTRTNSTALGLLYQEILEKELSGPRHAMAHLVGSRRPWFELKQRINTRARYLDSQERQLLDELKPRLVEKFDLDYHYTWQRTLRLVMRLHVPLALIMTLLTLAHVVVIYNFIGWHR